MSDSYAPGQVLIVKASGSYTILYYKESKQDKIIGSDTSGKNCTLSAKKIVFSLPLTIDPKSTESNPAELMRSVKDKAVALSEKISLAELYELVNGEEEESEFLPQDLAELVFPLPISSEQYLAMFYALEKDAAYFKAKGDVYIPKPTKQVQEILAQQEAVRRKEEKKQAERQEALEWLKTWFETQEFPEGIPKETYPIPESIPVTVRKLIEPIRKYGIFKDHYEKKSESIETLQLIRKKTNFRLKSNLLESAYILLEALGVFKPDENISLLKYHIPTEFSPECLDQANTIALTPFPTQDDFNHYRDLTPLFTITIDDESTEDYDDALSIIQENGRIEIFVHISDVARFVSKDSLLDQEALQRGMSVYLPAGKIAMFPEILSDKKISLRMNERRPAITYWFNIDPETGKILEQSLFSSIVTVDNNTSYNEIDSYLEDPNHAWYSSLRLLEKTAAVLYQKRVENGAVDFNAPDIKVKVDAMGTIHIHRSPSDSRSNQLVKEFMVAINQYTSKFCFMNGIPSIYICQPPPDEPFEMNSALPMNRIEILEKLRFMKKSEMSSVPSPHFSLGVSSYTQASSPIRRYHDLITQRQVLAYLAAEKFPYTNEDIQVVAATAEKSSLETRAIERENKRYWILKYLSQHIGESFSALVIRQVTGGYVVELLDFMVNAFLPSTGTLEIGQEIQAEIQHVNPRLENISIAVK